MMTVWVVYFKDTGRGVYVAAPTCAAAKEAFVARYGTEHTIRARHRKNVEKAQFPSTEVLSSGDPRLVTLGLRYAKNKE
jgi:hypothetical protein